MENFDLGPGFAFILLLLVFLVIGIRTILSLVIIHYVMRQLLPATGRMLSISHRLTGNSLFDFLNYETTFFFVAPVVAGTLQVTTQQFFQNASYFMHYLDVFPYYYFYFLSLTYWRYTGGLNWFQLKSLGNMIGRSILFLLMAMVLYAVQMSLTNSRRFGDADYFLYEFFEYVVRPFAFGLFTLLYIKRNRLADE